MSELDLGGLIRGSLDQKKFQDEHWQGTFQQYLDLLDQNPLIVRTAHQRLYDMIISYGEERPLAQGGYESAWAENRRAEFKATFGGEGEIKVRGTTRD